VFRFETVIFMYTSVYVSECVAVRHPRVYDLFAQHEHEGSLLFDSLKSVTVASAHRKLCRERARDSRRRPSARIDKR